MAFEIEKSNGQIKIETADFFGLELEINVTTETDPTRGTRYVYTIPALGNHSFPGNWRA